MTVKPQDDPLLGVVDAAHHAGTRPATWRAYVSRGQAPPPDQVHTTPGGRRRPLWRTSTVSAWLTARPGSGFRTDLHTAARARRAQAAADLAAPPRPGPAPALLDWVRTNRRRLMDAAETLVDERDTLLAHHPYPDLLAEAIDHAGQHLDSPHPTPALARAVARATGLLLGQVAPHRPHHLPDGDLAAAVAAWAPLHHGYHHANPR
jgi:hypothetical protein